MLLDGKVVDSNPILSATPGCLGKSFTNSIYNIIYIIYCIDQWFPNCEPRLPWEPWLPPRRAAKFFKKLSFIIILFHFGDIYTLQSILAVWSQMFICSAIMCYVHATK